MTSECMNSWKNLKQVPSEQYKLLNIELALVGIFKRQWAWWTNLKWVTSEQYEFLNVELAQMQWGSLKGNECSEHMNLWKKFKWVGIIFLNIELTWARWGLLKSIERSEFTMKKWKVGARWAIWFFEAYNFMKKIEVGAWWAI